jgi:acyl-CoA reductase-like NAD-dependent aldehyde dehydrogenase
MHEHRNLFLGGRWAASRGGTVRTVISPATEEVIGRVVLGSELDIDAAVRAARQAFDEGPWPRMHVDERRSVLRRAGDTLTAMSEALNRLVSSENGAPIRSKAAYPGAHFSYYTAAILLEDADVNVAAPAVLNGGLLQNNGQACASWTRILAPAAAMTKLWTRCAKSLRRRRLAIHWTRRRPLVRL